MWVFTRELTAERTRNAVLVFVAITNDFFKVFTGNYIIMFNNHELMYKGMILRRQMSTGKPAIWDYFVIVEFDASMISSTIELSRVQVLDRGRALLWRYSALQSRHTR